MVVQKVKVVLWKNLILRKRHWFITFCEVAIPVLLFLLVAYARSKISSLGKEVIQEPTYSAQVRAEDIYTDINVENLCLYYTPKTNFTTELVERTRTKLNILFEGIKGFAGENELLQEYGKQSQNKTIVALIFHGITGDIWPRNLNYDIRSSTDGDGKQWDTHELFSPIQQYTPNKGSDKYKKLLSFQLALDTSFIEISTNKGNIPATIVLQEFPYPPYTNDLGVSDLFMHFLPFITIFSFILLCPALLKRVVEEKYSGIKELMKMVGLQSWMLWLGWFLHAFVINALSVIVIVFLMKCPLWSAEYPPIEYCSASVYAVFLLLYCAACISFCFAISAVFDRPTIAMIVGLLVWILSYFVPKAVNDQFPNMSWQKKMLFALFPNMALSYGYSAISVYEVRQIGVKWENMCTSATDDANDVSVGDVFVMLLFDFVVYWLVAVYIDNIKPGPYGLPKPWHFPVSDLVSQFRKKPVQVSDKAEQGTFVENTPLNLKPGIRIRNLYKKYGKVEAVKGISLDIYKDQITVLLGHNGAGKSTTMSMITGLIKPTNGSINILGCKVNENTGKFTKTLGLCPQHNLLFLDLTVLEHLLFFAMLKGKSLADAKREARGLLHEINLYGKRNYLPNALSGGMKRKLCLGMAIIGNSEVLILDEPTTGLDPEARRAVWDLLLSYRDSRTILITTHFMEEADVLGDRIAIMSQGKIDCYGTPMYLKNKFGSGYNLTVVRNTRLYKTSLKLSEDELRSAQMEDIRNVVKKVIPEATVKAVSGNIITFLLPMESKPLFYDMLFNLENRKIALGIENISVSITTLEDVFLRVGHAHDTSDFVKGSDCESYSGSTASVANPEGSDFVTKVQALFQKKFYVFVKKFKVHFITFLTALFVTILTLYLGEGTSTYSGKEERPLNFDLSIYGPTDVYYSQRKGSTLPQLSDFFRQSVNQQKGSAVEVDSVSGALIQKGVENIAYYKKHLVVAAEFNRSEAGRPIVNVMFSNFATHGAPISLNLVMNALLKSLTHDDYSIFTTNAPISAFNAYSSPKQVSSVDVAILWAVLFPLGLLFLIGGYIIFPQLERMSNVIQLQFMSGIRPYVYWLSTYVFDFVLYMVAVIFIVLTVCLYSQFMCQVQLFDGFAEIGTLFIILVAYAVPALPYAYLFSYKKSLAGAFAAYLISGLFLGVIPTVVINVLQLSGDHYYEKLGNELKYVCLLLPQFGLTYVLVKFTRKVVDNYNWDVMTAVERSRKCYFHYNPCCGNDAQACSAYKSYMRGGDLAIGNDLLFVAATSVLYFLILFLLETTLLRKIRDKVLIALERFKRKNGPLNACTTVTTDGQGDRETLLEAKNLEKMYGVRKVVNGVTFDVKAGDCFGLLGVNGAGKTTTFKMLTGDETLTRGTAKIRGNSTNKIDISKNPAEYLRRMGYCPQFDALNYVLTGRQMLTIFAKLRGIPKKSVDDEVNRLLELLGLTKYADVPCGEYSGGNKRKLSIAVAFIGEPPLLLLDEPTSGVDPASRRKMWDIITNIKENNINTSVILTSHSMEECEALCNSLAIMKNGKIHCQGTIPKLKEQYGKGYTVLLKLKYVTKNDNDLEDVAVDEVDGGRASTRPVSAEVESNNVTDVDAVIDQMHKVYGSQCHLRDKHKGLLHYHIEDADKRWSVLFREIEMIKRQHPVIEDYTISDASLEDVFLEIAKL